MSVVLRCPSCGTTGGTAGECEACHDADVRYFCTAHTPGIWLMTSMCPNCGAHLGDPAPSESAPTPATPPPRPASDVGHTGERWPPADEGELEAAPARMTLWQELLRAAARSPYMTPKALPLRDLAPIGRSVGGCLVRIALIMLFLLLALVSALFLFGRALL